MHNYQTELKHAETTFPQGKYFRLISFTMLQHSYSRS